MSTIIRIGGCGCCGPGTCGCVWPSEYRHSGCFNSGWIYPQAHIEGIPSGSHIVGYIDSEVTSTWNVVGGDYYPLPRRLSAESGCVIATVGSLYIRNVDANGNTRTFSARVGSPYVEFVSTTHPDVNVQEPIYLGTTEYLSSFLTIRKSESGYTYEEVYGGERAKHYFNPARRLAAARTGRMGEYAGLQNWDAAPLRVTGVPLLFDYPDIDASSGECSTEIVVNLPGGRQVRVTPPTDFGPATGVDLPRCINVRIFGTSRMYFVRGVGTGEPYPQPPYQYDLVDREFEISGVMSQVCVNDPPVLDTYYIGDLTLTHSGTTTPVTVTGAELVRINPRIWEVRAFGGFFLRADNDEGIPSFDAIDDTEFAQMAHTLEPPTLIGSPWRASSHWPSNLPIAPAFAFLPLQFEITPTTGCPSENCPDCNQGQTCIQFGVDRTVTVEGTGRLKLYFNDDNYGDNDGAWLIEVFVNGDLRQTVQVFGNGDVTDTTVDVVAGDEVRTVQVDAPNGGGQGGGGVIYWSNAPPGGYPGWCDANGEGYNWDQPNKQPPGSPYWDHTISSGAFLPQTPAGNDFPCPDAAKFSLVGDIEP